jgi:hypothetical protein
VRLWRKGPRIYFKIFIHRPRGRKSGEGRGHFSGPVAVRRAVRTSFQCPFRHPPDPWNSCQKPVRELWPLRGGYPPPLDCPRLPNLPNAPVSLKANNCR